MPDGNRMPDASQATEEDLAAARTDREGAAWWRDNTVTPGLTAEGTPLDHAPSATPISGQAFDLIVEFEVSSKANYEARFRGAIWPKEQSGVTIGIGYDVGYVSVTQLHEDWQGVLSNSMLSALEGVIGITGAPAEAAAHSLAGRVDIPFDQAIGVHRGKVIPRWVGLTEDALANTSQLSADSLGALVSLTYNRGPSYRASADRYTEMRAVRQHMDARAFSRIPGEMRAMKRIWPNVRGLRIRREREAQLFEAGLAASPN